MADLKRFQRMNLDDESFTSDSDERRTLQLEEFGPDKKRSLSVKVAESAVCNKPVSKRDCICLIVGMASIAVIGILFIILATVLHPTSSPVEPWTEIRLPTDILPQSYVVNLEPDLDSMDVKGSVVMRLYVNQSTKYILFHAVDMEIDNNTLTVSSVQGSNDFEVVQFFNYTENEYYVIEMASELTKGEDVSLSLSFSYKLRDDLAGFYNSSYTASDGSTHVLAVTQFEPTDARRAFPCFDEPAMKANFSIAITHSSRYTATSNMPIKSTLLAERSDEKVTTTFKTSVKMSTYLVAFVVSDFSCTNRLLVNGHIELRVCANPVVFNDTAYALQVAKSVLEYYEELFSINYPLPKQDLFAIPDFSAGAMENWGLITYRETALIYNDQTNPATSKQRVAVVVSHELAHQWFGNLVTMEWWDGLWLNEGFASFVEFLGTNHSEPDWKMMEQFYVDTLQSALMDDSLNASHPILQNVSSPADINSLFDSISYDKGASIIRMLSQYMGMDKFTAGIKDYLNRHSYGNAETYELWDVLNQQVPEVAVREMMDTWTKQMGYPVITVSSTGSSNQATVSQQRFLLNPITGSMAPSPYNYLWTVPLTYITKEKNQVRKQVLFEQSDTITWSNSEGFIKLDSNENGFYRVNYDTSNWKSIIAFLSNDPMSQTVLSAVDRAGLVDDAFALSSAGHLDITTAMDLSQYLRRERDYVPWEAAFEWLYTFSGRLSLTGTYGKFEKYVSYLLEEVVSELHFNSTGLSHTQIFLRSSVLNAAWKFGNDDIANQALVMFENWMNDDTQSIPPDLRSVVYSAAIAHSSEAEWNFLWQRYLNSADPYERTLCLKALAKSTEPWILSRYLEYSISQVRSQDTLYVIRLVGLNVHGRYLAWDFFRQNWDYLFGKFGQGFGFRYAIRDLTRYFATEEDLQQVTDFFSEHSDAGSGTLAYQQGIETIQGNIAWLKDQQDTLEQWLDKVEA